MMNGNDKTKEKTTVNVKQIEKDRQKTVDSNNVVKKQLDGKTNF